MTDYERTLLGQLINSRASMYHEMRLSDEHWQSHDGKRIWQAIGKCIADGVEPDLLAVVDKSGVDAAKVSELTSGVFATSNWRYYEDKIIDAYRAKRLAELGELLGKPGATADKIDTAEATLTEIQRDTESDRVYHRGELIHDWLTYVEARYNAKGKLPGYETGLEGLDDILLGWQDRLLYYIGARPSGGKSAMLLQFADHLSLRLGIATGVISLESANQELITRTVARHASIDGYKIQAGWLGPTDFAGIQQVCSELDKSPLWLYDVANQSINRVASVARYMVRRYGVKCLFVDYEQIIRVPGAQSRREQAEVASLELKALARELEVPVVAAAQLRREVDTHKVPTLGDFQHSSQLEQDADGVILLHDEEQQGEYSHTVAYIAKNRAGQKGHVNLYFNGAHMRFAQLEAT